MKAPDLSTAYCRRSKYLRAVSLKAAVQSNDTLTSTNLIDSVIKFYDSMVRRQLDEPFKNT
jgi:hypothetical protein